MEEKYKVIQVQAKLYMPIFKSVWACLIVSILLSGMVYITDFCTMYSWPILGDIFEKLSSFRLVVKKEMLVGAHQTFEKEALCAIPVIFIPIKLIACTMFAAGIYGGLKHYGKLTNCHFTRKFDLICGALFLISIIFLIFDSPGSGKGGVVRGYFSFIETSYYFYILTHIVSHLMLTGFFLFHTGFYFSSKVLRSFNKF